jgi:hypothetical protein
MLTNGPVILESQSGSLSAIRLKRPASGCLLHERRNGQFVLQVTGHPSYGLPWGRIG